MGDKTEIHQKAREAIKAGKVPNGRPQRMWGGTGDGACCVICGCSVTQDEFGMDLEFARDDGAPDKVEHHFHVRCYTAWDSERCKFDGMAWGTMGGSDRTQSPGSPAPSAADALPASAADTTPSRHGLPVARDDRKIEACDCGTKSNPGPETA
jgi:hypothetical protein